MPTAEIPAQAMNLILEEFEILAKVDDGRLSTIIAFETPTRPGRYSNCISKILKHYTLNGKRRIASPTSEVKTDTDTGTARILGFKKFACGLTNNTDLHLLNNDHNPLFERGCAAPVIRA